MEETTIGLARSCGRGYYRCVLNKQCHMAKPRSVCKWGPLMAGRDMNQSPKGRKSKGGIYALYEELCLVNEASKKTRITCGIDR